MKRPPGRGSTGSRRREHARRRFSGAPRPSRQSPDLPPEALLPRPTTRQPLFSAFSSALLGSRACIRQLACQLQNRIVDRRPCLGARGLQRVYSRLLGTSDQSLAYVSHELARFGGRLLALLGGDRNVTLGVIPLGERSAKGGSPWGQPPPFGRRGRGCCRRNYDGRWLERLMPNLLIRWRRVFGWRFRIRAAPFGPSTTPPAC
jgi:hypothetical protein